MDYSSSEFWNKRYTADQFPFEWYGNWDSIKSIFFSICKSKNAKILHVGCGTSLVGEHLKFAGYSNVINIDFSETVLDLKKTQDLSGTYRLMDARNMERFPNDEFDNILDKGTLDSVLCGDEAIKSSNSLISEYYRVLKKGGTLCCFSNGQPDERLHFFQNINYKWTINSKVIDRTLPIENAQISKPYYAFLCTKENT